MSFVSAGIESKVRGFSSRRLLLALAIGLVLFGATPAMARGGQHRSRITRLGVSHHRVHRQAAPGATVVKKSN